MLEISVLLHEEYNELTQEYIPTEFTLELEHSLVSVSKWESKHKKAFVGKEKTTEETLSYIECMILTPEFPPEVFSALSNENFAEINAYIMDPMSATNLRESPNQRGTGETITAELIYYWMISLNIPDRFETWHLNRLLKLIRLCSAKNAPPKKMSPKQIAEHNRNLNAQRRAQLGTKG